MIFTTQYGIYLTFFLMLILAFKAEVQEKKALLLIILAIPIAILLIKIIHLLYFEPRPFVTLNFSPLVDSKTDASFPSRHATIMATIAFAYIYFRSKWSYLFVVLAILVGISRVYVGVHYPLDILGGIAVAIVAIFFGLTFARLIYKLLFLD